MTNFADRMIEAIKTKGNPCVVGLDFHETLVPTFVKDALSRASSPEAAREAISSHLCKLLDIVAPLVPAVKVQLAFLEQFTFVGSQVLLDVIQHGHSLGLIVIADAKRNDIASSAEGYAKAFLEGNDQSGSWHGYNADALTLNGFLGRDSLEPFAAKCEELGKGCFILVKTSNRGSAETQDLEYGPSGEPLFATYARIVDETGRNCRGAHGYSSIGAVVGATYPSQAARIRELLPNALILVPGYGAQGASADDVACCFNADGFGAVVNASRSVTYRFEKPDISERDYSKRVYENTVRMIDDIVPAIRRKLVGGSISAR